MAQLTWQNVNADFGGGGRGGAANLLLDSFDPLAEALAKYDTNQKQKRSMGEIEKAMGYTDPAELQRAMADGTIKIDPTNRAFFEGRVKQMYDEQAAKLNVEGAGITNENNRVVTEQNRQGLAEALYNFNIKKDQYELQPEVAKRAADLTGLATSGRVDAAVRLANDPTTVELFAKSGMPRGDIDSFIKDLYAFGGLARTETREAANAPNLLKQDELVHEGKVIDANEKLAKYKQDVAEGAISNPEKLRELEEGVKNAEIIRDQNAAKRVADTKLLTDEAKAVEVLPTILDRAPTSDEANLMIDAMKELNPEQRDLVKAKAKKIYEGETTLSLEEQAVREQLDGSSRPRPRPNAQPGDPTASQVRAAQGLTDLLGLHEASSPDTLFGNAERPGGKYSGLKVSERTIGELDNFARGGYGDWVSEQTGEGKFASPFGRYAIVNSTLQAVAQRLGYNKDTVFTQEVQDNMFKYLVNQRLGGARTREGQMEGLRSEWVGLKKVDDATLSKAIDEFQNGNFGGLDAVISGRTPESFEPPNEIIGEGAKKAREEFKTLPNLDGTQKQIVVDQAKAASAGIQEVTGDFDINDAFAGKNAATIQAIMKSGENAKDAGTVVGELEKIFPGMDRGNLVTELDAIHAETGLTPAVVAAVMKNAEAENSWFTSDFLTAKDNTEIQHTKAMALLDGLWDPDAKTAEGKVKGIRERLDAAQYKTTSLAKLKELESNLAKSMATFSAASHKKQLDPDSDINPQEYYARVAYDQEKLDKALEAIRNNPITRSNLAPQK